MERVIGQLVNFATIVGGRLSLEPEHVAVRGVIDDAVRRWRKRVTDAHEIVRRVPAGTPAVEADRTYLRSEEHTSELQSLMRISYAVFCLTQKKNTTHIQAHNI